MVVVVLSACPVGLRGDLTRWLLEIAPGVFVGHLSARVREKLWERIDELVTGGRAIMVYSARNEQHLAFHIKQPDWEPADCDGLQLIRRPKGSEDVAFAGTPKTGWSSAGKYHRAHRHGGF